MNNIERALEFLQETYNASEYFKRNPSDKEYRYQHTLRVASIAKELAEKETTLDKEVVVIGALLHDISYAIEFKSKEDWKNHGRNSAKMSKDFLNELELTESQKKEILLGIASHVDGEAGMDGELTTNALTISDSDNLDRFDIYRTFETLPFNDFYQKTVKEQIDYLHERLESKERLLKFEEEFVTQTAKTMWIDRVEKQMQIYEELLRQLESGFHFQTN
jgi:uncharacterized protein